MCAQYALHFDVASRKRNFFVWERKIPLVDYLALWKRVGEKGGGGGMDLFV
jgi:hypothetical protein